MNENQLQNSELLATKIMRVLAVVGSIAILAFTAWVIVKGVDVFTNKATVGTVLETTQQASSTIETLNFLVNARTLPVDKLVKIAWTYNGTENPRTYTFSYSCGTATSFNVLQVTGWTALACNTPLVVDSTDITLIPVNNTVQYSDIELRVEAGTLKDTMIVTVLNNGTIRATSTPQTATTTKPSTSDNTKKPTAVAKPVPSVTKPQVVPMYSGPADLALEILETGIMTTVSKKSTFLPVSPIPTNKTAAVTFIITNKGGITSEPWYFKAELPLEGDKTYDYTSPKQSGLLSGMVTMYTLSFDELLEAKNGTIKIRIYPSDKRDVSANNTDSVTIKIDER